MKILYFTRPCFGDCDFPLIKALRAQGHNVTVIFSMSPHSLKTTVFDIKEIFPKCGIFPITIYHELQSIANYTSLDNIFVANDPTGRLGWSSFKLTLDVLNFLKKGDFDIIHYVETPSRFLFLPLYRYRKKLVITIHDGKPHTGEGNKSEDIRRSFIKRYVKKFIVLNKEEVEVFSREYNVPKENIYTSHLGYYDMLHMYGDNNKKRENYVLFFGRISPYKGIEYLLEAMVKVHQNHPDIKVIVAGSGAMYFDISKFQSLDYVEIRNRFIGLDELSDLIRGAKLTVCPYTDATQSGVIYSSFALSTPVIATRVGGLPEMIDDGITGVIIPPKDTNAMAQVISFCLDNPEYLNKLCNNINESSKYGRGSWDIIAKEYIEIYQK